MIRPQNNPRIADPAQIAAIVALYGEGMTYSTIANRVGSTKGRVAGVIYRHRTQGAPDRHIRRYTVPIYVHSDLAREAKRRGMKVADLAARLMAKIASDNLFGAVLDDAR